MPGFEDGPAVHISHVVRGRCHEGNRAKYKIDPTGVDPELAVPETVVVKRWRRRRKPGVTFTGTRLSPTVWRALHLLLDTPGLRDPSVTVEALRARLEQARPELRARHFKTPSPEHIAALVALCGPRRLKALLARHQKDLTKPPAGVPDVFLYARGPGSRLHSACFVEVKRPKERVSLAQREEIQLLRELRLRARVLHLVEG